MLDSSTKPCKQHAKQKSCLTESENISLLLDSSNKVDKVGNAFVSTRFRAAVIQYSDVRGGKKDADRVVSRSGTLLTIKDRNRVVVCVDSLCNFALAKRSKDARIKSMVVDCRSP